jgi:hypothetical protein
MSLEPRKRPAGAKGDTFSRRKERPDGTLKPKEVTGPWSWDGPSRTFRNAATSEEVRLSARVNMGHAANSWYRFDYAHAGDGAAYPLLVEVKRIAPEPYRGIGQWVEVARASAVEYEERAAFAKDEFPVWRIDHDRSLLLWQAETGAGDVLPPYGLWRRADIAMIAAALTLPPVAILGPAPEMVIVNGGWLNGEWRPHVYRRATYSWHRASGADKYALGPDGKIRPGHGAQQFYPEAQAWRLPLHAACPRWSRTELKVRFEHQVPPDTVETVAAMREERTGEVIYPVHWRSFDPLTGKESWQRDLAYAGYGLVLKDAVDFRYRPAEQVLVDPINISQDFALSDFVHTITTPARARFFEFYDLDLARTLLPDLKVSQNLLQAEARAAPEDLIEWRELRKGSIGSYRLSLVLHEAFLHALPFATGFDAGAPVRTATLGERATFDFKSGETGCQWLYETTLRLSLRLPSDGDGPGWEEWFD